MAQEKWLPVVGWEARYEVSDQGRVRSVGPRGRVRALTAGSHGYLALNLSDGSRRATRTVHRLVLEAFVGPCPDGMEACHADADRHNNRLTNLRWDTTKANAADRVRAGHVRSPTGQTHCKHGHEFTEANTYRPPSNPKIRQCRECGRLHHANRRRASA